MGGTEEAGQSREPSVKGSQDLLQPHILKTNYNFTSKEAGVYIRNNEVVNELHYSPYHEPTIREKMQRLPLKEAQGWL